MDAQAAAAEEKTKSKPKEAAKPVTSQLTTHEKVERLLAKDKNNSPRRRTEKSPMRRDVLTADHMTNPSFDFEDDLLGM